MPLGRSLGREPAIRRDWLFGQFLIVLALRRMDEAALAPDGSPSQEMIAATGQVKRLVGLELLGFIVIFKCMILMRFGL